MTAGILDLDNELWFYDLIQKDEIKVYEDGLVTDKNGKDIRQIPNDINKYIRIRRNDKILGKRRSIMVHRLVWIKFKGKVKDPLMQINHLDCNKQNNNLSNLELITRSENMKHAIRNELYSTQFPIKQVIEMRDDFYINKLSKKEIMEKNNIGRGTLEGILRGNRYSDIGHYDINEYNKLCIRKLTNDEVIGIRDDYYINKLSKGKIMKKYNIPRTNMDYIIDGKTYSDLGHFDPNKIKNKKQKLTNEQVLTLRDEFYINKESKENLCKKYNLCISALNNILQGMTFTDLGHYDINEYDKRKKENYNKRESNKNSISIIETLISQDIQN